MSARDDYPHIEVTNRGALQANHATARGAWLVRYRKAARPDLYLGQREVASETLCFGWIDSQIRKLDDTRNRLLITPRQPGSPWSRVNKQLIDEAIARG